MFEPKSSPASSPMDLQTCLEILETMCANTERCLAPDSEYQQILRQVSVLNRRIKATQKAAAKSRDQNLVENTSIRTQRASKDHGRFLENTESTPQAGCYTRLAKDRMCYICKRKYARLHSFYDCLCPDCAEFNFRKRSQAMNLQGQTVLLTGGRIKIGFQAALMLLRAGAEVLVTSRFPTDTLQRYCQEPDHEQWLQRLSIYSADFRFLPTVEAMCEKILAQHSHLDILINNAAQTVRRPPEYYRHLLSKEQHQRAQLPKFALDRIASEDHESLHRVVELGLSATTTALNSQVHVAALLSQAELLASDGQHGDSEFPAERYDADGQQIDLRRDNSWIANLNEVELPELLEVHAVNALVPFILIQRLQPLLETSQHPAFIVNVTAMEGHFATGHKTGFHPHTNMAKAAMNMITRTCAERFAQRRVYMNSVDTGWVTNEYPAEKVGKMQERGFEPPLDEIDGAARVLDPVITALESGEASFGKFYKDYHEAAW